MSAKDLSVSVGAAIPPIDIIPMQPPETVITGEGIVLTTLAKCINEEYEYVPFGLVATFPAQVFNAVANVVLERALLKTPDLTVVLGIVGTQYVFQEAVSPKVRWYKPALEKRVKRAQRRAAQSVMSHLELE